MCRTVPQPPDEVRDWFRGPYRSAWGQVVPRWTRCCARSSAVPKRARRRAIAGAVDFAVERLNGEDGLGAIYPAMANSVMMFDALGYAPDHPHAARPGAPCASCWSWSRTCLLPALPLPDLGHRPGRARAGRGRRRRRAAGGGGVRLAGRRQVTTCAATGRTCGPTCRRAAGRSSTRTRITPTWTTRPSSRMLLHRTGDPAHADAIERARDWVVGMQSSNGGWGAFDADNDHQFLNHIPFADHGALLDPPTVDVTARCVSFLAQIGHGAADPVMARALDYLRREQEADGSWFGRWGTNYIYGTWSALCALNAVDLPHDDPAIRRGAEWLLSRQRADGGWGEDEESYADAPRGAYTQSTPSQTAWALLGLMAAGEVDHPAVAQGIEYLRRTQRAGWRVGRGTLHRGRLPARVLPALPRLPAVLPAAGAGALPQPAVAQQHAGDRRVLTPGGALRASGNAGAP